MVCRGGQARDRLAVFRTLALNVNEYLRGMSAISDYGAKSDADRRTLEVVGLLPLLLQQVHAQ